MTVTLSVRLDAGANVVKVTGDLDEGMAALLAETLGVFGPSDAVVLDLSGVVYQDRSSLQQLLSAGMAAPRSRLLRTAVVLPRRASAVNGDRRHAVAEFASVPDALQALVFHREGYGPGWLPHALEGRTTRRAATSENGDGQ